MEKYGVDENVTSEKLAEITDSRKCPNCGKSLSPVNETGVLHCPTCGTRPFEEK
jgi:DNA-directed RNA polymerase subunit RPC12/RpoP